LSLPDSTTDLHGIWDPRAIRRAIENLCNNAIKYGARGTRVTVAVERPDVNFVITVHNYGPAIAPEQQGRLFVAFERGEARERGAGGVRGWGIGLALVRAIAEAHGGRVHLESSAVNGTSFILELLPSPRGLAGLSRGPAA
jgi:signal transduction histidine kinase